MSNIRPTGNKILVERIYRARKGSIVIPETVDQDFNVDTPFEFKVLETGPKVVDVRPGDRVICYNINFGPTAFDDTNRRLITEDLVLLRLRDEKE